MPRRGVHDSGALIERDVFGEQSGNVDIHKRVLKVHAFEIATFVGR